MFEIKPIKTKSDYEKALQGVEALFEAEPNTPEGDRLEMLVTLVQQYEDEHYSLPHPTKPSNPSNPSKTDWEALEKMTDEEIDFSDIPEITEEQMAKAVMKISGKPVG